MKSLLVLTVSFPKIALSQNNCEKKLQLCEEIIKVDDELFKSYDKQIADYQKLVEVYKKDKANLEKQLDQKTAWYMSPMFLFGAGILTGIAVSKWRQAQQKQKGADALKKLNY